MRLVWVVIPLVLVVSMIGIIGMQESFAEDFSFDWGKSQIIFDGTDVDNLKVQLENGAEPREVICDAYLYLIYKTSDGSPICVKEHYTVPKLIERGFATLGETSLVITTDKEVYSLGESITITMKNQGDTTLIFSGAPTFYMESQLEKYIDFPLDVVFPPTENIVGFDTLASTTYVWNQTKRNLETVNASTYTVYTTYLEPVFIENIPHQLSHKEMRIEKTFEIIDETKSNPELVDATNVIDANNQFAIDFYSQASQESDESIFFSPWSISTAFAIAFEGAKGATADEIRQVFGFPSDYQKRTTEFKSAMDSLNPNNSKFQLSVANALWLAEEFEPYPEYVDTATNFYDSEVSTVDFVSNDGVDKINAWVENKTQEKIKDILKPGSTNEDTRLAITNAIYFKGNWVTQFNENNTSTETFWNDQSSSEIPLMHLEPTLFNYTQTDQLQILKMPYEGDRLSMLVLLPNENDGLGALEKSLSKENLNMWQEQLTTKKVEVFMPKFKLETTYNLVQLLMDMGMTVPFSEGIADFGGIAPISLFISQAIHKAFVDVNEEGTEAAAATVIVITTESYKPPPPIFRADHPFVFLIQDDSTGNILFIGRMVTP